MVRRILYGFRFRRCWYFLSIRAVHPSLGSFLLQARLPKSAVLLVSEEQCVLSFYERLASVLATCSLRYIWPSLVSIPWCFLRLMNTYLSFLLQPILSGRDSRHLLHYYKAFGCRHPWLGTKRSVLLFLCVKGGLRRCSGSLRPRGFYWCLLVVSNTDYWEWHGSYTVISWGGDLAVCQKQLDNF